MNANIIIFLVFQGRGCASTIDRRPWASTCLALMSATQWRRIQFPAQNIMMKPSVNSLNKHKNRNGTLIS